MADPLIDLSHVHGDESADRFLQWIDTFFNVTDDRWEGEDFRWIGDEEIQIWGAFISRMKLLLFERLRDDDTFVCTYLFLGTVNADKKLLEWRDM